MNWTRAHDAWIAEHCEGLEVSTEFGAEPHEIRFNGPWKPVATYNTDPAACIRAAEAWAAKDAEYRTWSLHRAGTLLIQCMDDGHQVIHEGEDGLAWCLYESTGGPA
jgi:hypothetical protein